MGWKNYPYWVRGGLIGLIPLFVLGLADFILTCNFGRGAEFCGFISIIGSLPIMAITIGEYSILPAPCINRLCESMGLFLWIVLSILTYFTGGALIGFIVGKIKSKK